MYLHPLRKQFLSVFAAILLNFIIIANAGGCTRCFRFAFVLRNNVLQVLAERYRLCPQLQLLP